MSQSKQFIVHVFLRQLVATFPIVSRVNFRNRTRHAGFSALMVPGLRSAGRVLLILTVWYALLPEWNTWCVTTETQRQVRKHCFFKNFPHCLQSFATPAGLKENDTNPTEVHL